MKLDPELAGWQAQWRTQATIPPILVHRVQRDLRRMWWGVAAEIAVTVIMGGGSAAWAVASHQPDVAALAGGLWIILAIAWSTSVLLRHGAWQPAAVTTAAFIEISVLRCRRALWALTAQAILFVPILTFDLVWLYVHRGETDIWTFLMRPAVVLIGWGGTLAAGAAALWHRRTLRREMDRLRQLRHQLEDA